MATLQELADELKSLAGVEDSETVSTKLQDCVTAALRQHDKLLTVESLPVEEEECVLTLAWVKVCLLRASEFSKASSASGGQGFGSDRDTPYKKCMDLAEKLSLRYADLCSSIKRDSTRIVVGQVFVRDQIFDALVPMLSNANLPRMFLKKSSAGADYAVLSWFSEPTTDFYEYFLFYYQGAEAIYQEWNISSATGVPRINDSAMQVMASMRFDTTSAKITDLDFSDPSALHRYLLVQKTRSGKFCYSNEIILSDSADTPPVVPTDGLLQKVYLRSPDDGKLYEIVPVVQDGIASPTLKPTQ